MTKKLEKYEESNLTSINSLGTNLTIFSLNLRKMVRNSHNLIKVNVETSIHV